MIYNAVIETNFKTYFNKNIFHKENGWSNTICFSFRKNMCAPWSQSKLNHTHFLLLKGTCSLEISVQFGIMNNFAELQLLSMMAFLFNTLPRWTLIAPLLKCVSDFTAVFFLSEELFSWTYILKKDTTNDKITSISSLYLLNPFWTNISFTSLTVLF